MSLDISWLLQAPSLQVGLNHAGKYPAKQLVIHSSGHFFLPSLHLSHTWRLQNVRLDDVGSVHDRGRRRQIAQVVNRLLAEGEFIPLDAALIHCFQCI